MHTPAHELFPPEKSVLFPSRRPRRPRSPAGWCPHDRHDLPVRRRQRRRQGRQRAGAPEPRPRRPDDRRRARQRAQGHARHPGRRDRRHRDPALLRPPAARPRRRVPPVPRRRRDARPRGQRPPHAEAAGVVHDDGVRGHGRQHAAHVQGRRQGAAGRHGAAPHQPPARLPGLRQGRRVPPAEPGDERRPPGVALRGRQAHLPQAGQHLLAGAARPRALRALRPLHPLLRPGRRRPVHRARRAWRAAADRHLRGQAVRELLLGQHRPDLPGRRADRRRLPLPQPPVRPRVDAVGLRALRERLRDPHRPPSRRRAAPDGGRGPGRQRGVELRQGPLGVHLRHAARPHRAADGA